MSVLLAELRAKGLRLSMAVDGRLLVAPRASVTGELDALIRESRSQLIEALQAEKRGLVALQEQVREMAARWQYTLDEIEEALTCAAAEPEAWQRYCQMDEEMAATAKRAGRVFPQENET